MYHELYRGILHFGGYSYIGGIVMLIGIILVGLLIFLLVKNNKSNISFANTNNSESILKERLAKGDISEDDFDRLIKKLKKT